MCQPFDWFDKLTTGKLRASKRLVAANRLWHFVMFGQLP
jgi:hypothetical protein